MKLLFRSPTKQRRQRNRHYWQTCARKRGYKNAAHARKSAARAGHRHRAYACPICGRWHLTKTAKEA